MKKIEEANREVGSALARATEKQEVLKQLERQIAESERGLKRARDQAVQAYGASVNISTVSSIQSALVEYQEFLIANKINILQHHVTECFNLLARKKDALRRIVIDSRTFQVKLLDRKGHAIEKSQLSAGEKQIYAISILWALAKTSGRPLPMIVDTPLARLDRDHRSALAHHYFPRASHQTVILSTDTEIDEEYVQQLRPALSRVYRLDFLESEGRTEVKPGYFWEVQ